MLLDGAPTVSTEEACDGLLTVAAVDVTFVGVLPPGPYGFAGSDGPAPHLSAVAPPCREATHWVTRTER